MSAGSEADCGPAHKKLNLFRICVNSDLNTQAIFAGFRADLPQRHHRLGLSRRKVDNICQV